MPSFTARDGLRRSSHLHHSQRRCSLATVTSRREEYPAERREAARCCHVEQTGLTAVAWETLRATRNPAADLASSKRPATARNTRTAPTDHSGHASGGGIPPRKFQVPSPGNFALYRTQKAGSAAEKIETKYLLVCVSEAKEERCWRK